MLFSRVKKRVKKFELFFVMFFLMCFTTSASFMLLAFFSLQVYTITKFPFKARHFWKRTRIVLCCVGIWLVAVPLGFCTVLSFPSRFCEIDQLTGSSVCRLLYHFHHSDCHKNLTCWDIFKTRRNSGQSQSTETSTNNHNSCNNGSNSNVHSFSIYGHDCTTTYCH